MSKKHPDMKEMTTDFRYSWRWQHRTSLVPDGQIVRTILPVANLMAYSESRRRSPVS